MIDKLKGSKDKFNLFFSQKTIGIIIFIITLFVLTFLLASRYYLFQNVIEGGISKKNIIASKTVRIVDIEKTQKRKNDMANKVEPILRPAQDAIEIDQYVKNQLSEILNSIKAVRESKKNFNGKIQDLRSLLSINNQDYFANLSLSYLLKSTDKNFSKTGMESKETVDKILKKGLSEAELKDGGSQVIEQNIDHSLSATQKKVIGLLVKKVIHPNMVVDDIATEIAKKNVSNSVKPVEVVFKRGERIVAEGDLVTKVQRNALKKVGYNVSELDVPGILGIFCLVAICLYTMAYYLINFETRYLSPSYLSLMSLLSIAVAICAVFLPLNIPVFIIPIPAVAILLTVFTDFRVSVLFTVLIVAMLGVALQYEIPAIAVFVLGGMFAAFAASKVNYYRRMDLVRAGFDVGIIQFIVVFAVYLLQSSFEEISFSVMFTDIILSFVSGLISGIIALGTLPLIESAFKIVTPYGLAELADHNQELLRRLQFEAPGTYHHSLMVSNLCEAAAEAIDANPVLARVGAFYHDIGKLKRPLFFVENQSYFGIENPHEKLNPRLSKMVITAHPKDGLELAKEYKLPQVIHQFISQHHGCGLAAYFYKKALEEEGAENITEEQFRYSCQKPASKETAILMLADAVESAVRSLKNPTPEQVEEMIDKLIKERLFDGQLSDSPLTQRDLKNIALSFKRILRGMQHQRIKYHENIIQELGQKPNINIPLTKENLGQELVKKQEIVKSLEKDLESIEKQQEDQKND